MGQSMKNVLYTSGIYIKFLALSIKKFNKAVTCSLWAAVQAQSTICLRALLFLHFEGLIPPSPPLLLKAKEGKIQECVSYYMEGI